MGALRQSGRITQSSSGPYTPVKATFPSEGRNNMGNHSGTPVITGTWATYPLGHGTFYLDDGGVFTDYTTEANNNTANDVKLLPVAEAVNDAFYIGTTYLQQQFKEVTFLIGTAGIGNTIAWEYYNGAAWVALAGVVDGTAGFTAAAGIRKVTWTPPTDWATVAVNGKTTYWIRARCTAALFTQQPQATRVWVYGDGDELVSYVMGDSTETKMMVGTLDGTDKGTWDLYINDVLDSSGYDCYAAAPANTSTLITLTQPIRKGYNTIRMVVNTKNASSTDYLLAVYGLVVY